MEASRAEQTGEVSGPATRPVRKVATAKDGQQTQAAPTVEGAPEPDVAAAAKAELARRVAQLDRWVAQQMESAPAGATVQAAPPGQVVDESTGEVIQRPTQEQIDEANRVQMIRELSETQKKKLAISGGEEERRVLMGDPMVELQIWVLKNPDLTEVEVVDYSQKTDLAEDALNFLLQNRRWATCAPVARNLALHSGPPPEAIPPLLTVLPVGDLKALAATPGIRHLVARQARRILMERSHI